MSDSEAMMIDNTDDLIDSRDVIDRIDTLQARLEDADVPKGERLTEEECEELSALLALAEEGSNSSDDWPYGATLIRDSYFKEYAQELAEEIGAIPSEGYSWPASCIDWDQAARELRMDYSAIDFDGVTYWVR